VCGHAQGCEAMWARPSDGHGSVAVRAVASSAAISALTAGGVRQRERSGVGGMANVGVERGMGV